VCCSVLQCVAVRGRVWQCLAVSCRVLQGVAGCCRVLQGVAGCCRVLIYSPCLSGAGLAAAIQPLGTTSHNLAHCSTLHYTTSHCNTLQQPATHMQHGSSNTATGYNLSQLSCGVICCIVLQCVFRVVPRGVMWCNVLQCVAVCCSVLQCVAVCCSVLQCATN